MKNIFRSLAVVFYLGMVLVSNAQSATQPGKSVTKPVDQTPTASQLALKYGRYDIYSGIPSMYLGHTIISADGKYKVALSSDEDTYDIGTYIYHAESNNVEWKTGMFKNNNWGGKIASINGVMRIQFNKATYAQPK